MVSQNFNPKQFHQPDFLIIGAAKSGTTSLFYYFKQHPQIFLPENKEPGFFAFADTGVEHFYFPTYMPIRDSTIRDAVGYRSLFGNANADQRCGEASTIYLSSQIAPKNIRQLAPNTKMIAILRNPIQRAYSNFNHFRADGLEPEPDFIQACFLEEQRKRSFWYPAYYYLENGMYSTQLRRYFDLFPADQIKVYLYEDLANPTEMVQDVLEFIGVDANEPIDTSAKYNISGQRRLPWLYGLVRNNQTLKPLTRSAVPVKQWNMVKKVWDALMVSRPRSLTPREFATLAEYYQSDVRALSGMIGRDLEGWLRY